jgi:hypothetical protein
MPDAKSGRVHILRQLAVPSGGAAEDTGNHLLLSVTRRSERCRSGSEIPGARLYERQGAERRSRSVEGCGIRDELMASSANGKDGVYSATAAMAQGDESTIRSMRDGTTCSLHLRNGLAELLAEKFGVSAPRISTAKKRSIRLTQPLVE